MDRRLPTGTIVDRYVVLEGIGAESTGTVYTGFDPELDRKVVLELLSSEGSASQEEEALLGAARAMAKLAHPNVVQVHRTGTFEDRPFLVMDFVDGPNLRTWLDRDEPNAKEILAAYVDAGRGLAAAHAAGVVHGDFAAEHVRMGKDGRARVTNFGRAGRGAEPRGDQFDFCRALRAALDVATGGDVRRDVRHVLRRGLHSDPAQRYPSMDQLIAALTRDPRKRLHRALGMVAVVLSMGAAVLAWQRRSGALPPMCHDAARKLSGLWDTERKAEVQRVFLGTGKPYAADAWRGIEAELDAYARDWSSQFADTCNTARGRGSSLAELRGVPRATFNAEIFDLRMTCLHEHLDEVRALIRVFMGADGSVVARALGATQKLPRLAACSDPKALTARIKPPTDPETASKVEALRKELVDIKAMEHAAKYQEALPLARKVAEAAQATGYAPIEGEALFWYGELQGRTGDDEAAGPTLYRAAWVADQAGDDRTRARVWSSLLYYVAANRAHFDKIPIFREQAMSAIERLGGDDELMAELLNCLGTAQKQARHLTEARAAYADALSRINKSFGPESMQAAVVTSNLANSDYALRAYDQALEQHQRALAIGEKILGGKHPLVANIHAGVALDHLEQLHLAEAETAMRHAIDIMEEVLGKDYPGLPPNLNGLGFVLVTQGRYAEALPYFQRSLARHTDPTAPPHPNLYFSLWDIGEAYVGLGQNALALDVLERAMKLRHLGSEVDGAETAFALARALTGLGRDAKRAHALAEEALTFFRKDARSPREKLVLGHLEAWVASHPR